MLRKATRLKAKIPGFDNYLATDNGLIVNATTNSILKQQKSKSGYLYVAIKKCNKWSPQRVNRLIAFAFIPNPESKPQVNHKNGIKTDNNVKNLEWCTASENQKHCSSTGLRKNLYKPTLGKFNEQHHRSKSIKQLTLTGMLIKEFPSFMEAKRQGFNISSIHQVCTGKRKKHKGFIWQYSNNQNQQLC